MVCNMGMIPDQGKFRLIMVVMGGLAVRSVASYVMILYINVL